MTARRHAYVASALGQKVVELAAMCSPHWNADRQMNVKYGPEETHLCEMKHLTQTARCPKTHAAEGWGDGDRFAAAVPICGYCHQPIVQADGAIPETIEDFYDRMRQERHDEERRAALEVLGRDAVKRHGGALRKLADS